VSRPGERDAGRGIPVEIGSIDRELARLWEEAGDSKTRASLLNLVLYSEEDDDDSSKLVADIAAEHACRAIVILARPPAPGNRARAWINAHCHKAGSRQICSEQITFELEGASANALPGIVFPHLDSDLPLCLWWRAPLRETMDARLWSRVDRLVFDSAQWDNPAESFVLAEAIANAGDTILCDLNWARILGCRLAIAALFDHPKALGALPSLDLVEIHHAPGFHTAGALLLGWLASRAGWSLRPGTDTFVTRDGRAIPFRLVENDGPLLSLCAFHSGSSLFSLTRRKNDPYFLASVGAKDELPRMLPAGPESPADLLLSELARGGRHGHYRKAIATIGPLL
jgi:glucose-6-phosphate dehydrogenase assembly protein OpcA